MMSHLKCIFTITVLSFILFQAAPELPGHAEAGDLAGDLDFVVIKEGAPGTTQDAQPVMDALAGYVGKRTSPASSPSGIYFNDLQAALSYLANNSVMWGIVTPGFLLKYGSGLALTPVLSTRPGGREQEVWRLVVARGGPDDWTKLKGKVFGTMFYTPEQAALWGFDMELKTLPFDLEGTARPLRTLRSVARGKATGIMLEEEQFSSLKSISLWEKLKLVHESAPVPTSQVVWFGRIDSRTESLASILLAMKNDPEAADLLTLLRTEGFGPADKTLKAQMAKEPPGEGP